MAATSLRHRAEALGQGLPPLLIAADRIAATVAHGVHGRRRAGAGDSFWQFRPYAAGDAAQRIDWRQTARTERAYVREREWEAAQSLYLWSDRSASMDWRSAPGLPSKRERADLLLLALAALALRGGERVALVSGGRATSGPATLGRLAVLLAAPDAEIDVPAAPVVPRAAAAVLIGDFLGATEPIERALGALAAQGATGHLLQVLDPAEETLPFDGRVRFDGLEREGSVLIDRVDAVRDAYRRRLDERRAWLAELARQRGWSVAHHRTDQPAEPALIALYVRLAGREAAR